MTFIQQSSPLPAMSRLSFFAIALFGVVFHAAATTPTATADTTLLPPSPTLSVSLALAGLPTASAQPESRVFFTVQADVYLAGEVFIAAGARAKGRLMVGCSNDSTLCWVLFPEAVQTTDGTMQALEPAFVRLTAPICDLSALKQPFRVEISKVSDETWVASSKSLKK